MIRHKFSRAQSQKRRNREKVQRKPQKHPSSSIFCLSFIGFSMSLKIFWQHSSGNMSQFIAESSIVWESKIIYIPVIQTKSYTTTHRRRYQHVSSHCWHLAWCSNCLYGSEVFTIIFYILSHEFSRLLAYLCRQDSTFKKSSKKYELLLSVFIMDLDPRKCFRLFFSRSDIKLLKEFASDRSIVVTKPDKGKGVVIIDRDVGMYLLIK